MKKLILVPLTVLVLAATLAACGGSDDSSVEVSDAWTRVTAPTQDTGAIYARIESPDADRLIKASVPADVATTAEIHEVIETGSDGAMGDDADHGSDDQAMDDGHGDSGDIGDHGGGMMGMREVDGIDLPAGTAVTLEPGGFHIMLMGLAGPIKEGDKIPVTFTFEQAGEMAVDAPAREG